MCSLLLFLILFPYTTLFRSFALLGVFFLHTAAFLLNDVQDHLRGLDRLNRRRCSQVIQKGWVSPLEMKRWAWVNLALAVLRSEEHTSELQSLRHLVCRLLLE